MSGDSQRGPGSGGTANRGRPGAGQARQDAGGQSPPGDGQDHLPLEVIISPHRAVVAPLVNYLWTLHEQRPDLTLTVAVPELVDRHWWHRIMHEHVAERLQPILQSLPRVVITSVPFHLAA
jgi:hypothetical protein